MLLIDILNLLFSSSFIFIRIFWINWKTLPQIFKNSNEILSSKVVNILWTNADFTENRYKIKGWTFFHYDFPVKPRKVNLKKSRIMKNAFLCSVEWFVGVFMCEWNYDFDEYSLNRHRNMKTTSICDGYLMNGMKWKFMWMIYEGNSTNKRERWKTSTLLNSLLLFSSIKNSYTKYCWCRSLLTQYNEYLMCFLSHFFGFL